MRRTEDITRFNLSLRRFCGGESDYTIDNVYYSSCNDIFAQASVVNGREAENTGVVWSARTKYMGCAPVNCSARGTLYATRKRTRDMQPI